MPIIVALRFSCWILAQFDWQTSKFVMRKNELQIVIYNVQPKSSTFAMKFNDNDEASLTSTQIVASLPLIVHFRSRIRRWDWGWEWFSENDDETDDETDDHTFRASNVISVYAHSPLSFSPLSFSNRSRALFFREKNRETLRHLRWKQKRCIPYFCSNLIYPLLIVHTGVLAGVYTFVLCLSWPNRLSSMFRPIFRRSNDASQFWLIISLGL